MSLLQVLLILKARYKVAIITFAVIVGLTTVGSLIWPKTYKSTAYLLLNNKGLDPVTGLTLPAQLLPGYMATQIDIIQSPRVANKVVDKLGLANSDIAKENYQETVAGKSDIDIVSWLAGNLLQNVEAKPSKESSIIEVSFKSSDSKFAAIVANAFAEAYMEASIQLKVEPSQKAAVYFTEQIKTLRENLDSAQAKLSKYQQEMGFTSIDERMDVETARLSELSSQLSAAQAQSIDSNSRSHSASSNGSTSPDVAQSPIVQSIKIDISRAEAKLADLSQRVSQNHPQYISASSELDKLRSQLKEEISRASASVNNSAIISRQRESELREQVALQKEKVLELNRMRAQLTVLQKDVENSQMAINAVTQRFSQVNLEGQSNQSDIAILNPATPTLKANSPKFLLNILVSVFIGSIMGITFAFLAELQDRRVRSKDDLSDILEVPIFSVASAKSKPSFKYLPKPIQKLLTQA